MRYGDGKGKGLGWERDWERNWERNWAREDLQGEPGFAVVFGVWCGVFEL